jgi:hypothetical protein
VRRFIEKKKKKRERERERERERSDVKVAMNNNVHLLALLKFRFFEYFHYGFCPARVIARFDFREFALDFSSHHAS